MTGPYHYKRAEEILAEIEAANAVSNETETALAIRAQAHAILALAAATAIDPAACRGTSGTTSRGIATRAPSDRAIAQPQPGPGARRVRRSLPGLRGTPGQVLVPLTDLLTRPGGTGEMQPDAADGHLTDTGRAS